MSSGARKLVTKAVAVVVIVALLDAVGISPVLMMFVTGMVLVIWIVSRRSQSREIERIFEFFVSADAILREEERRWYGFEIAEVIENGEHLLESMPDSPPVHYFALGALYHRMGNHEATAGYLSRIVEDENYEEGHRTAPSPQLRRYVSMLRRIESEPSLAPNALAAVRSLERARRKHGARLLGESRNFLKAENSAKMQETPEPEPQKVVFDSSQPLSSVSAPPPISEVLQDIYHDESTASH